MLTGTEVKSKIKRHFKKTDPILYQALEKLDGLEALSTRVPKDHFIALTREIIAQQLSGRVAEVIFARFKKLFPKGKITPRGVLKIKDEELRATGMSWSKVKFIKDLAQRVVGRELDFEKLSSLEDEGVIGELIKVKGIGRWTAEMFLMFTLGREDVFSKGDLGLKNAIKKLYGVSELADGWLDELTQKWSPYKTYACLILWNSLDNQKG